MARNPEDKKERILKAALELFCERGFHGTAVPLVADRAQVSVGLIYRHFSSKEQLVNQVYRACKREFGNFVEGQVRSEPDFRAQFRRFFLATIEYARNHPEAFFFLETHHHTPYLDEASQQASLVGRGKVLDFLDLGVTAGLLKPLPHELLLAMLWGPLVELIRLERAGKLELEPVLVQQAEQCCWDSLTP
jgi:AcrR family transcriptional regulator